MVLWEVQLRQECWCGERLIMCNHRREECPDRPYCLYCSEKPAEIAESCGACFYEHVACALCQIEPRYGNQTVNWQLGMLCEECMADYKDFVTDESAVEFQRIIDERVSGMDIDKVIDYYEKHKDQPQNKWVSHFWKRIMEYALFNK